MKKIFFLSLVLVFGAMFARAQGIIAINVTTAEVYSNGVPLLAPAGTYSFEALDMTESSWNALSPVQQDVAYDLIANPSDISLWTDSGVSGENSSLHAGGINAVGGAVAANWAAPAGSTYETGGIDYYTIVGWTASGGTWSQIATDLQDGALPPNVLFGQTAVAFNDAGGGPFDLAPVNLFADSSATDLPGSGGLPATDALEFDLIPEPTTLALISLGGISILFLRRRKVFRFL